MLKILLLAFLFETHGYEILVISGRTRIGNSIQKYFSESNIINHYSEIDSVHLLMNELNPAYDLIIDCSLLEISRILLKIFSNLHQIPTIILGSGENKDFLFYSENEIHCRMNILYNVISYFDIENFALIWKYSESNSEIIEELSKSTLKFTNVNYGDIETLEEIGNYFVRVIKNQGIMDFLTLGDQSKCDFIEETFEYAEFNTKGNLALYMSECIYQSSKNGSIIIVNSNMENSTDYTDYLLNSIKPYLKKLKNALLNNFQITSAFNSSTNNCEYSLINIQNQKKVKIGTVTDKKVTITNPILYLGDTPTRIKLKKPIITISANTGTTNPPGYPPVYANAKYQLGTYFGISKVNSDSAYLANYELDLFDEVKCGVNVFVGNYSKSCFLSILGEMGVAYIPSFYSITINVLQQFNSLGITIPVMSGMGSSPILSNRELFPTFTHLVSPLTETVIAFLKFINLMNWQHLVVFYSNESFGQSIYDLILNNTSVYKYSIVNSEKFRAINPNYNSSMYENYEENIKDAVNTGCNLFVLAMTDPTPYFWIEGLYDYGIRKGDVTIFFSTITGIDALNSTGGNYTKRAELMYGSFVIYNAAWVGEYGEMIQNEYLLVEQSSWMPSFYIDAVYTIATTLEFLTNQGKNIGNHSVFMNAHRKTRLLGCSGTISFDSESNDRNLQYYNLYNFYQDNITNQWHGNAVSLITPLATVYYTVLKEPVWSSGAFPLDMKPTYYDCAYLSIQIVTANTAINAKIMIYSLTLLLTTLITITIGKLFHFKQIRMMQCRRQVTAGDYLVFGYIIIGAFQILSIGPNFNNFNTTINTFSNYISLNISDAASFRNEEYWTIFYIVFGLTSGWILLIILASVRLRLSWYLFQKNIRKLRDLSIPIIANYGFIPIVISLFSIFSCDYGIGQGLTDSLLNTDCRLYCWRNSHLQVAIPALICAFFYIPLAISYTSILEEQHNTDNIKTNPEYLLVQNLVCFALIAIGNILQNEFIFSIIFAIANFTLLVYVYFKKAYNFDRANLWVNISNSCVLWNSFVCIFNLTFSLSNTMLMVIELGGWFLLFIAGVCIQKRLPPSLIVSEKGISVSHLFRFVFGLVEIEKSCGQSSTAGLSEIINKYVMS